MCQHRLHFVRTEKSARFLGDQNGPGKGKREGVSAPQQIQPDTGCWTLPMMRHFAHHLGQLQVGGSKETQPTPYTQETIKLEPEVNDEAGDQNDGTSPVPLVGE